jgi:hypothetical protein
MFVLQILHRVETLKEFCGFIETEFGMILGYAQTRWLSLLLALEKVKKGKVVPVLN